MVGEIKEYFIGKTFFEEGNDKIKTIENVSDTLISKIILGTFGCTVAYDRYVKIGLRSEYLPQSINKKSICKICDFAKNNQRTIEVLLRKLNNYYTPMKILDMYFFEKGFEIATK